MIIRILWLLKQYSNKKLVTSCFLSLSLVLGPVALANDFEGEPSSPDIKTDGIVVRYNPPSDQKPPEGETGNLGTRGGCEGIEGPPLTALAPRTHIGETVSTHPTLAWFVPESKPFSITFRLFEYASDSTLQRLGDPIELQSTPGVMKLPLPKNKPGLAMGKTYLWEVRIRCDVNSPSMDLVTKAEVEVVEIPESLESKLSSTNDSLQRASAYGEAGLWYNALSEALVSAEDGKLGEGGSSLLEDLAKLEKRENEFEGGLE
ncbi:MAG: DUF928 domain-containing protein [Symploca sp. SIO2C1]|nr:DUF928 domain-containing protein [Symploca sp. SIO2C1]